LSSTPFPVWLASRMAPGPGVFKVADMFAIT
jgi:hypothetical protein